MIKSTILQKNLLNGLFRPTDPGLTAIYVLIAIALMVITSIVYFAR